MSKLSESLAPNVLPVVRDYIDARIAEAIEPVMKALTLQRTSAEAVLVQVRDLVATARNELGSVDAKIEQAKLEAIEMSSANAAAQVAAESAKLRWSKP